MPKTVTKPKPAKVRSTAKGTKSTKAKTPPGLNSYLRNEIARLSEIHGISTSALEEFAQFVIDNHKKKGLVDPAPVVVKPLTLPQLKAAIYEHFSVKDTTQLKKSGSFQMATDGMDNLNLGGKEGWERLYRKFIGILPGEENQQGYGCINGINVFNYFKPWQVFGLDPKVATTKDIKTAYHNLSKIYHPDNQETGDATIFDCLTVMYKSISAEA